MAIIKKSTNKNAGDGVEKREPSYTIGGNVNWYSYYGEQYGVSLKKNENLTYCNTFLGHISGKKKNTI